MYVLVVEMNNFQTTVTQLVKVLEMQSENLQKHRLYAIGLRNKLYNEKQDRLIKENNLKAVIRQHLRELERYQAEYDSLCQAEQNIQSEIEKYKKFEW